MFLNLHRVLPTGPGLSSFLSLGYSWVEGLEKVAPCSRACSMFWPGFRTPGAGTAVFAAAINGQASLRGMWLWARAHSDWLTRYLSFHRNRIPALETAV
jgi:hypothetical protein